MVNIKLLEEILELVKDKERNDYDLDVSLNLTEILKEDLDMMGVKTEEVYQRGIKRYKIFDGDHEIKIHRQSVYHNNTLFGHSITNDKFLTEKYLKRLKIPTSNSILLRERDIEKARKHIEVGKKQYVVKPISLMQGLGVFTDVNSENLDDVWKRCFAIQKRRKVEDPRVLVQDYIEGVEVRVNVLEGTATSVTIRTPAYVIGNGKDTISDLIKQKNEMRSKHGFFRDKPININNRLTNYLASQNRSLETVIEEGKLAVVNPVTNMRNGGENIVITDFVKKEILELAEETVAAIPGIQTAGLDVILNDLNDTKAVILEINKAPAFQLNYYPYIGEPQRPFQYIFKSLILEDRILKDRLDIDQLSKEDIQLMSERYIALYKKQKSLEKTIQKLSERRR